MAGLSRVFTIPASAPFLPTLISALLDGRLVAGFAPARDPVALSRATLYLPTQRACRLARDTFLEVLKADAALLPRIVPLGDIDEDEIAFAEAAAFPVGEASLDIPAALDGLTRRMLLAQLVLKWAEQMTPPAGGTPLVVPTPATALALADDLARLMDDMITRGVDWARLDGLVPENLDEYWLTTLKFLKIAVERWPLILAAHDAIEPALRRDRLITEEARRLDAHSDGPVIAAGSTGSMPATARLITTIAGLPHGAAVLPGLDTDLDEEAWGMIGAPSDGDMPAPTHPQFAMHGLLRRIGITRDDVIPLAAPAPHGREALVSEAMRPAAATEHWRGRLADTAFAGRIDAGFADVAVIEAANAEEEAIGIAVALREAVETPGRTAALVTPDRALARRVTAALGRWGIEPDDSSGARLADTAAGRFARLVARCALGGVAPVDVLAPVKHPLFRLGAPAGGHRRAIAALEMAVLRGSRPRAGTAGLLHALAAFRGQLAALRRGERTDLHSAEPRTRLDDADLMAAADMLTRLSDALAPLEDIARRDAHSFAAIAALHRDAIARLGGDEAGRIDVLAGADGIVLAAALDDISSEQAAALPIAPAD